jgi:hypothetical protein
MAPASETGLIAPASVNGVATTGWPWRAICMRPSPIGPSRRNGEFVLMTVIAVGSPTRSSSDTPPIRLHTSSASSGIVEAQRLPRHPGSTPGSGMSRWRVSTGRSVARAVRTFLADDVEAP